MFNCCPQLKSVTVGMSTPLAIDANTFTERKYATLYVPAGSKAAYQAANYWKEFRFIEEYTEATTETITISSAGVCTFCSSHALDFSGVNGLKAYVVSGFSPSTSKLTLTPVTEVPAGEGLLLKGAEGTYEVPFTTTDMYYSNLLTGVTVDTPISITEGDQTNFILANGKHGIGFYTLSEAGTIAVGKAYLHLPTAKIPQTRSFTLHFDGEEVMGIATYEVDATTPEVYTDMQGRRVINPRNGIYIVNGKKVIVK